MSDNPSTQPIRPPDWLPAKLRSNYSPVAPEGRFASIAGDYIESELWMLENHVADLVRGKVAFVIAPMNRNGGVGTYRIG